ncbi:hypothetical protein LCGC14_0852480 [marine sediment metagenome]|uniref:Uncharacterized protein n=1 Tax=marine sediment metagenome TaxID=412755 RepID=A0A0F9SGV1_9ZZZZ
MNFEDIIYTKEELEYLKFVNKEDNIVTYKDNVGNQYLFEEVDKGLKYLSTIKNRSRISSGWGN